MGVNESDLSPRVLFGAPICYVLFVTPSISNCYSRFDFGTFYENTNFNGINGEGYYLFSIVRFGTLIVSKKVTDY